MSALKARLEFLRRKVDQTAYDAMTQVGAPGVYYLRYDPASTVGDLEWGDFVSAYHPQPVRAIFLDNPAKLGTSSDPLFEVTREAGRNHTVIVITAEDAAGLGTNFLNADGTLDTSGRFVVQERWPMNFTVEKVFVKHLAGRPWRYVLALLESDTSARIDEPGENLAVPPVVGSPW